PRGKIRLAKLQDLGGQTILVVLIMHRKERIPSETGIHGQARSHLPGILCEQTKIFRRVVPDSVGAIEERGHPAQKEVGETVPRLASIEGELAVGVLSVVIISISVNIVHAESEL